MLYRGLRVRSCLMSATWSTSHMLREIEISSKSLNRRSTWPPVSADTRDRYMLNSLIEEAITSSQLEGAATTREVAKEMIRTKRKPVTLDERGLAHERLAATVPTASAPGIVHGDYRLDNCLVDDRDRLAAVIDWEMATLGDPLADLALTLLYHRLTASLGPAVSDVSAAPGFLTENELLQRYAARSRRDLGDLGWYLGLAAYKLAGVLEGIHYRYQQGQTVGEGFDHVGEAVRPLLATGLEALGRH